MLIAQITDTHITLDGRQADDLRAAVHRLNALRPRPDVVLLSGDTVNDGRSAQYALLAEILAESAIDVFAVPGNHDRSAALRAVLPARHYPGAGGTSLDYTVDTFPVRLVGIDTTAPRRPGGIIDRQRLDRLDQALSAAPARPTLLFMHHPPFRTGVNLADMFGFAGLRRFEHIVAAHRQVRRIIAGHVHCERSTTIGAALVTTAISSTPQLVPELFERRIAGMRPEPGGFTLHAWANDAFTSTTFVHAGAGRFTERSTIVSQSSSGDGPSA